MYSGRVADSYPGLLTSNGELYLAWGPSYTSSMIQYLRQIPLLPESVQLTSHFCPDPLYSKSYLTFLYTVAD